jgi:hypothetical protein
MGTDNVYDYTITDVDGNEIKIAEYTVTVYDKLTANGISGLMLGVTGSCKFTMNKSGIRKIFFYNNFPKKYKRKRNRVYRKYLKSSNNLRSYIRRQFSEIK